MDAPEGIAFAVENPTRFSVQGIDKQQVGEVAANIRKLRKPDPYKGKGVRYAGEQIRRKVGKAGKPCHPHGTSTASSSAARARPPRASDARSAAASASVERPSVRAWSSSGARAGTCSSRSSTTRRRTVVSASTMEADLRSFDGDKTAKAKKAGELVAERAKARGVASVVFDRGGNKYHGRVAAIADGAREGGLSL